MATLILSRHGSSKEFSLAQEVVMGRASVCDVRVPSNKSSRRHCRIFSGSGGFFVEDLKSANGTLVNGDKVGRRLLNHGDTIGIGGVEFTFNDQKNTDPLIGQQLGAYRIIAKAGAGGMGVVYRAKQESLNREVAVKVLNPKLATRPGFIESFEREARLAAKLQHPNIIAIHDFGKEGQWNFFSMEFVDGENLLDRALREGGVSPADCRRYGVAVAQALAHAHGLGILHKDVKPHNVMLDRENNIKLADMGLACLINEEEVEEDAKDQKEGKSKKKVIATPQYVAPEIIKRQEATVQSDIYSLSATLYHVLTGKTPYQADNVREMMQQHLNAPIPDPRQINSEISVVLAQVIMRGLAKDPADRQKSAADYVEALRHIPQATAVSQTAMNTVIVKRGAPEIPPKAVKPHQNRAQTPLYIGGGILALLALLFFFLQPDPEAAAATALKQYHAQKETVSIAAAKLQLDHIITAYPKTAAAGEAAVLRNLLNKSKVWQKHYKIKTAAQAGKLSAEKALAQLQELLQSGAASDMEVELISASIESLGGQVKVRYAWEDELAALRQKQQFKAARQFVLKAQKTAKKEQEKAALVRELQQIDQQAAALAKELLASAAKLTNDGGAATARVFYAKILSDLPEGEWTTAAVTALTKHARAQQQTLQTGWQEFNLQLQAGDIVAAAKAATKAAQKLAGGFYLENYAEDFSQLADSVKVFRQTILANARKATWRRLDHVKIDIDGELRQVKLDGRRGKLFAVGQSNRKQIKLTEVSDDDLARIAPRSQLPAAALLGAAAFFAARENTKLSAGYLQMLLEADYVAVKENLPALAQGGALFWQPLGAPAASRQVKNALAYESGLNLPAESEFSDSSLVFTPEFGELRLRGTGRLQVVFADWQKNRAVFNLSDNVTKGRFHGAADSGASQTFAASLTDGVVLRRVAGGVEVSGGGEVVGLLETAELTKESVQLLFSSQTGANLREVSLWAAIKLPTDG